ncbi:MAG: 2-oxoacid:acceptor oxidoreductase family protein [Brevinematales bacterium]|nr:2-oxoacid:acceptor oxidoreductase family protein [Brevinematales bacterium]
MTNKMILSGFGGQGLLTAGLILAEASVMEGYNATYFPSYGAEMRGGTANCHIIISDEKIASPIISKADMLAAFNKPSLERFSERLIENGLAIINSSVVKDSLNNIKAKIMNFKFDEICLEKLGTSKFSNVILIGIIAKLTGLIKENSLIKAIENKFSEKGQKIVKANIDALKIGFSLI